MEKLLIALLLVLGMNVQAQTQYNTNLTIHVKDVDLAVEEIKDLCIGCNYPHFDKSTYNTELSIELDSAMHSIVVDKISEMGVLALKTQSSTVIQLPTEALQRDVELLEMEKELIEELIESTDSTLIIELHEAKTRKIEVVKELMTKKAQLEASENMSNKYLVFVQMKESIPVGAENYYGDSWINMPGIEYSFLSIENPLEGESASQMHGVSLKYMFNYKKTYALLSLYKANETNSPTQYNEIYMFALGQDFYSKRMGGGKKKWLNLYTSFNTGVYMATGETSKLNSWFLNPFLGLEIYKSKNILIDNKVGYFVPFKSNRNTRGLLYNVSFNFAF